MKPVSTMHNSAVGANTEVSCIKDRFSVKTENMSTTRPVVNWTKSSGIFTQKNMLCFWVRIDQDMQSLLKVYEFGVRFYLTSQDVGSRKP